MDTDTKKEIELLRDAQRGNELLFSALALLLHEPAPVSTDTVLETLAVMDLYATCAFSNATALPIQNVISNLRALTAEDIDPKLALAGLAAQYADAGPDRRDALRTWLSQATSEELGDELRQLLRRSMDPRPDK